MMGEYDAGYEHYIDNLIREIEKLQVHIVSQGIQNCCAHRQKTYKGYRWEYAEVDG